MSQLQTWGRVLWGLCWILCQRGLEGIGQKQKRLFLSSHPPISHMQTRTAHLLGFSIFVLCFFCSHLWQQGCIEVCMFFLEVAKTWFFFFFNFFLNMYLKQYLEQVDSCSTCDQKLCNEVQTCFYFEYSPKNKMLFFSCGFWRFFKENPAVVVTILSIGTCLFPTSLCHCRCPGGALCPSELVGQSFLLAQDIFCQGKGNQMFLFVIWLSCNLCGSAESASGA